MLARVDKIITKPLNDYVYVLHRPQPVKIDKSCAKSTSYYTERKNTSYYVLGWESIYQVGKNFHTMNKENHFSFFLVSLSYDNTDWWYEVKNIIFFKHIQALVKS